MEEEDRCFYSEEGKRKIQELETRPYNTETIKRLICQHLKTIYELPDVSKYLPRTYVAKLNFISLTNWRNAVELFSKAFDRIPLDFMSDTQLNGGLK